MAAANMDDIESWKTSKRSTVPLTKPSRTVMKDAFRNGMRSSLPCGSGWGNIRDSRRHSLENGRERLL